MRDEVSRIAAKFSSGEDGSQRVHPLICHMLDVATVAEAIWQDCLAERLRLRLSGSFQLDEESARRWVAFLAGAHDLGKATPVFQAKGSADRTSSPPWLKGTQLAFKLSGGVSDPGHGVVTAAHLPTFLTSKLDLPKTTAERLAVITGGHHGLFPSADKRKSAHNTAIGEPRTGQHNPWHDARGDLATALAGLLEIQGSPASPSNAASMILAGFISVVDWIGSIDDEKFFPYDALVGPSDLKAYLAYSRMRARQAVKLLKWDAWPRPDPPASFQSVFPSIQPRHLQVAAQEIAASADGPGLAIIEAPMGEGKTEAAFYMADCRNADGFRGAYVAMPTQATSNQLYERFREFLARRYGAGEKVNLQLLHGHASLSAAVKLLENDEFTYSPDNIDADGQHGDATVGAAEWFTYRKRGLLAPFGVGTVDQALLSVLQVRHGFVRLFGLAGKTIIIDEVHAYDTYMTTLLERLLEWLAALDSPVVLLSATLPQAKRRDLLNAYRRGLGAPEAPLPSEGYARITWATSSGVQARAVKASAETRRKLGVQWLHFGVEGLAAHLLGQLRDGGCAAVICNTVNRAQEVYTLLRDTFATLPDTELPDVDLFHARFLFKDRQEREDRCLKRFGKPGRPDGTTTGRPRRAILVATQVIEQSLDLDFDIMVSELAPADLLLQRSGRQHRHRRTDRRGPRAPILQILAPELDGDGLPKFERATTFVYDEHILLRTWHALHGRDAIAIPEDVEDLIEAVYGESGDAPAGASEALVERWRRTFEAMEQKREREREEAMLRRIPTPIGNARLEDHTRDPREEDAPELHPALQAVTRLTELSVQVALIPTGSPLLEKTESAPSVDTCRAILRHSVSVTAPDVTHELLTNPVPPAWRRSGLLRRVRVLTLDERNMCQVGNVTLHYDPELGLKTIRPQ